MVRVPDRDVDVDVDVDVDYVRDVDVDVDYARDVDGEIFPQFLELRENILRCLLLADIIFHRAMLEHLFGDLDGFPPNPSAGFRVHMVFP